MSRDVRLYLEDIAACIGKIKRYVSVGRDAFMADELRIDGVARNFEIIGEAAKRLPPDLTARYPAVPWKRVCGFRDILIHAYDTIDLDQVWRIIEVELPSLEMAVEEMRRTLSKA